MNVSSNVTFQHSETPNANSIVINPSRPTEQGQDPRNENQPTKDIGVLSSVSKNLNSSEFNTVHSTGNG